MIDVRGFVLANIAPGKEPEFFSHVGNVPQVVNVFYLFEDYEYLLEVQADSAEELAKLMANRIRHLPGVMRTATYIEGGPASIQPVEREPFEVPGPKSVW